MAHNLYRVRIKTTGSLQPGVDNDWHSETKYCGNSKNDAMIEYHLERPNDYYRGHGNAVRETVFEFLDPGDLADDEVGEFTEVVVD